APDALASPLRPPPPHPGGTGGATTPIRVIVEGGMPGWQITLIAAGAAMAAAALAVLLDRARASRKAGPHRAVLRWHHQSMTGGSPHLPTLTGPHERE